MTEVLVVWDLFWANNPGIREVLFSLQKEASRPSCHLLQHQEAWTAKLSSWKSVKQTKITSHEVIQPPVRFSDREQPGAQPRLNTLLFTPSQAKDWLCKSSLHPARLRGDLPAMDADKSHLNMKEVQSQGTTPGNFFTMNYPALRSFLWRKFLLFLLHYFYTPAIIFVLFPGRDILKGWTSRAQCCVYTWAF